MASHVGHSTTVQVLLKAGADKGAVDLVSDIERERDNTAGTHMFFWRRKCSAVKKIAFLELPCILVPSTCATCARMHMHFFAVIWADRGDMHQFILWALFASLAASDLALHALSRSESASHSRLPFHIIFADGLFYCAFCVCACLLLTHPGWPDGLALRQEK